MVTLQMQVRTGPKTSHKQTTRAFMTRYLAAFTMPLYNIIMHIGVMMQDRATTEVRLGSHGLRFKKGQKSLIEILGQIDDYQGQNKTIIKRQKVKTNSNFMVLFS